MSQSVNRLKELLFEPEAQALAALERRVSEIDRLGIEDREALRTQVAQVLERAGSTEQFTQSVADTIDEALRRAEVHRHSELSLSIAPLVVTTIKAELKNSQDEMVEALYPITGRLVKAYVASAIKDLTEEMNRRLELNPVMLRLQSLTTGRSVGEIALAATQDFQILELFLIRRGSGELVEHWPQTASGREHLMSGVLAAVNAFANEALSADEGALRQIDLGDETVYLRGSQLYLLAAKCSGTAPKRIEQTLDDAFLATIEKELHEVDKLQPSDNIPVHGATLLNDLGTELKSRIETQKSALRPSGKPLKVLAVLILLPLLAWTGWHYWVNFANQHTREAATAVIAQTTEMQGYPTHLEASAAGQTLSISGLTPSQNVKAQVISRIGDVLPKVHIIDELTVVPGSDIAIPDATPQLNALRTKIANLQGDFTLSLLRRAGDRAAQRVGLAARDLKEAAEGLLSEEKRSILIKASGDLSAISKDLSALNTRIADTQVLSSETAESLNADMDRISARISLTNDTLGTLIGASQAKEPAVRTSEPSAAADAMATNAERLSSITSALLAVNSIKLPEPKVVVQPAPKPDAITLLSAYIARHAIFFANGTDYRDTAIAEKTLEQLAALMREADVHVRIVGYTDELGNNPSNSTLAGNRSKKVRDDLIGLGVPAELLISIGRQDARDISPITGPNSPNRRVNFELAYEDEAPQ